MGGRNLFSVLGFSVSFVCVMVNKSFADRSPTSSHSPAFFFSRQAFSIPRMGETNDTIWPTFRRGFVGYEAKFVGNSEQVDVVGKGGRLSFVVGSGRYGVGKGGW